MDDAALRRLADLAVEVGANVQPGQIVAISADLNAGPFVRELARSSYRRGALFVDPFYFDGEVKRVRVETADPETLDFVPPWYGHRMLDLGEHRAARIGVQPNPQPGLLEGVDPALAGRDGLPFLREIFKVINDRSTNWTVVPYPSEQWAVRVRPGLDPSEALARLEEEIVHVCRLDADDPAVAWAERAETLTGVAGRLNGQRFDALQFEGEGTDFTVGLLPTSNWQAASSETADGIVHMANLPTEEVHTAPDPERAEGVVRATKPLDVEGTLVRDLRVRFAAGRAVAFEGENAAALEQRASSDEGGRRLGEVALVDREGRIGKLGTVFLNTLLDENAASHIALGNAYATSVAEADRPRLNTSGIHIDFMIGGDDVQVTGITAAGERVPVLRGGSWQL